YVLFSDATLKDLCRYFPTTKDAMLEIKGIGEKKYEQYGELFSRTIQTWLEDNPDVKPKVQITSPAPRPARKRKADEYKYDGPSHMASYKLFQSGKSIKEIAEIRNMNKQTIEGHIFKAYKEGHPLIWDIFFNQEEEKAILEAHEQIDEKRLKPLKDALPETFTYLKIKAVLVKNEWM